MLTTWQAPVSDIGSENVSAIILPFPVMAAPNRIKELRLAQDMSQEELAALVGCSKMQISGLERGKPRLDVVWMHRIAPWLQVTPGELLNPGDNPTAPQTEYERRLLDILRRASPDDQEKLLRVAEALTPYGDKNDRAA